MIISDWHVGDKDFAAVVQSVSDAIQESIE